MEEQSKFNTFKCIL